MTDTQWLSAIGRYQDESETTWLDDRVLGGARELASELEERTTAEPERFARLLLVLPDDSNEAYFGAITHGLRNASLPLTLLAKVAEHIHNRSGRPHGRWLCDFIAGHGDQSLPSQLLDMVTWYATEDADPTREDWRQEESDEVLASGGDPRSQGINSVRGRAALAIARLISGSAAYWEHFSPVFGRMVRDPSLAVRTCVAEVCTEALRHDRPAAIDLFLRLCDADDILLGTRSIEEFIYYAANTDLDALRPLIERMLRSEIGPARKAAARQAMIVALSEESAETLAAAALAGEAEMRQSAAEVLARNALSAPRLDYAQRGLIGLFVDSEVSVRRAAGEWIRWIDQAADMESVAGVLTAYIDSPTFALTADGFFRRLENTADIPPALLLSAGQRFVDAVGTDAANTAGSNAFAAQLLSQLIVRAYRQAENDPEVRKGCLDLFDRLLEVGGYGADETLDKFER